MAWIFVAVHHQIDGEFGVRQHVHTIDDWVSISAAAPKIAHSRDAAQKLVGTDPRVPAQVQVQQKGMMAGGWMEVHVLGSSREFHMGPRNQSERQCASGLPKREFG